MKPHSKILIIAGSDSSGGAGVQADIKTITSLGSYAMTAITAITSQNTTGVFSILPIPPKEISKQIEITSNDINPDAIKIGMLHSEKVIKTVLKSLKKIKAKKIILDPVMVAKSGTKLINKKSIELIKTQMLKRVDLITPNIPEAEILASCKINNKEDMIYAANILLNNGAKNVLVKGGHLPSSIMQDVLVDKKDVLIFKNKKINTINTHGTGCTLSSAIASYYSCGKTLKKSCELAIMYVNNAIRSKIKIGKGNGPINHLNSIKIKNRFK